MPGFFQMNGQNKAKELQIVDSAVFPLCDKSVLLNKDVFTGLILPIVHLLYPPNLLSIVFNFSCDDCNTQEK